MLFILNGLYFELPFFSLEWVRYFFSDIIVNIDILVSQNWYYLSPLFRSFLFLLLIWLMSYLLHYWFVQMNRIFLFIVMTFIYITVLDTFTPYDAAFAIIRIFVVSLVALALTNMNRELEKENIATQKVMKHRAWWVVPLAGTILFSLLLGIAAPKYSAQWPDPVPFIEGIAGEGGGAGEAQVQKVGYGEDDSQLGGSFIQDNTPVFQVEASQEQYWRIETKDIYTGKGWEKRAEPVYIEQYDNEIILSTFNANLETEEQDATVQFLDGQEFNKLVYPYGVKRIENPSPDANFVVEQVREFIEPRINGEAVELDQYQVIYDQPSFSLTELQESDSVLPEQVTSYLQLPETLPERVYELAEEITESHDSQYDKVRAIERYFSRNDFSYETTDVAVPDEDEDYVDQFLFETQAGYCDNFSTSMVVLLRTLDIPARWAKGFTSGEVIGETDTDKNVYEVTNANAHSWVEVYFPDAGWVSFEPTQGFTNLTEFHVDREDGDNTEIQDDRLDAEEQEMQDIEEEVEEEEAAPAFSQTSNRNFNFSINWWQVVLVLSTIVIIGYLLYRFRFPIKTVFHSINLGRRKNEQAFQGAYHHLLDVLNHEGYERKENQTLREYAKRIDRQYKTDEMQELTSYYERMLYRKEFHREDAVILKRIWKQLLKTIRG